MWHDTSPLPEGWSELAVVEDVVVADGVELRRAGLSSTGPGGEEVTGAAVDAGSSPVDRSYFELLERVSTLEALRERRRSYSLLTADAEPLGDRGVDELFPESHEPARWRYARSNGVALHSDWRSASLRASWELAERDRVLRAWCGETRPQRLDFSAESTPLGRARSYEWRAYAFPEAEAVEFSRGVQVVGVFGFPTRADAPLICGYGARPGPRDALDAAAREAMQLLAFLWGEPLLDRLPDPAPTAMRHLEHFQWPDHHDILRGWLDAGHERFFSEANGRPASRTVDRSRAARLAFVDLTPGWMCRGLRVAKAICDAAMPLAFGDAPFTAHLPPELRVHPVA
jgi:hypothetical protein